MACIKNDYCACPAKRNNYGFTIVELLVVIVVIGILAAITIVSYTGISNKAAAAAITSDLSNASKQISLYQVANGVYPSSLDGNHCFVPADDDGVCLKPSAGNDFSYSSDTQSFILDESGSGNMIYRITDDYPTPTLVAAITGIGAITGTTNTGSVLTAGALTPAGATATYQWQSATTSAGTYTNIAGATASTYTLAVGDLGKYIKVVATGISSYGNTVTSSATAVIKSALTAIAAVGGTKAVGSVLTAGALTPAGATATYQWQSATTSAGTYTNIAGATATTYTLVAGDLGKYIKVIATGSGNYSGAITSAATTVITTPLTGIGAIAGTTTVGSVLTAGALTPAGATATYQWQSATTSAGTYTNIAGATASTYTLVAGDVTKFLKVIATGSGSYTGAVTSAATIAAVN